MSREQYYDVIRRPVITEKSTLVAGLVSVCFDPDNMRWHSDAM